MYHRVFGQNDRSPSPAEVLQYLEGQGFSSTGDFRGDDEGWFEAQLTIADVDKPIEVQLYLASEEGIRRELNTWAAWVEDALDENQAAPWMQKFIGATQVITLRIPDGETPGAAVKPVLVALCRYLAEVTAGFYQIDGAGIFSASGGLMIAETSSDRTR